MGETVVGDTIEGGAVVCAMGDVVKLATGAVVSSTGSILVVRGIATGAVVGIVSVADDVITIGAGAVVSKIEEEQDPHI